jgi:Clp amino terminal domain, pathogenicity island component
VAEVPNSEQLVAAIEREHAGGDVSTRLEAAVRAGAELRAVGDELVDHYVRVARKEGRSWTDIGGVLGITKQGAQKRFTPSVEPWPSGFGTGAQAVVAHAVAEARALGHRYLGTEHLLLGLFSSQAGLAARCLTNLSLSHDGVQKRVIDLIGRGENPPEGPLGITPRTKRVFEATRREGRRCPEPEHLLLALYAVPQGRAHEILTGFGATETRARETLAELLDREAPELAERIRQPPRRRLTRR